MQPVLHLDLVYQEFPGLLVDDGADLARVAVFAVLGHRDVHGRALIVVLDDGGKRVGGAGDVLGLDAQDEGRIALAAAADRRRVLDMGETPAVLVDADVDGANLSEGIARELRRLGEQAVHEVDRTGQRDHHGLRVYLDRLGLLSGVVVVIGVVVIGVVVIVIVIVVVGLVVVIGIVVVRLVGLGVGLGLFDRLTHHDVLGYGAGGASLARNFHSLDLGLGIARRLRLGLFLDRPGFLGLHIGLGLRIGLALGLFLDHGGLFGLALALGIRLDDGLFGLDVLRRNGVCLRGLGLVVLERLDGHAGEGERVDDVVASVLAHGGDRDHAGGAQGEAGALGNRRQHAAFVGQHERVAAKEGVITVDFHRQRPIESSFR